MIVYVDSSALVKLYVLEPSAASGGGKVGWESEQVRALIAGSSLHTSRISYPEIRAALARRRREGVFANEAAYGMTVRDVDADWQRRLLKVDVSEAVAHLAGVLAERHSLRGYDAVHLASAVWLEGRAGTLALCSFDKQLQKAAEAEGLSIT